MHSGSLIATRHTHRPNCYPVDTLEIIRQLQGDPALKAELRAVLLGEEVLGLPELVKENSRQIATLTEAINE